MVDSVKASLFSGAVIFEGTDGNKYALNPFARPENQTQVTIECSHCDITFESLQEFEHHNGEMHNLTIPKKVLSLTCNICTATFTRHDHLKRHVLSLHTNQKFSNCPVCGKNCVRPDMLLKHIKRRHGTGTHVFHCRECEFACTSLSDLDKHEQAHLRIDRHLCPHCSTTFKRRDHMLRHIKSQHLNQFVVCPVCSLTYKRKDHLTRHLREKHNMADVNGTLIMYSDPTKTTSLAKETFKL